MTDRELMQQALEALEETRGGYSRNLIAALRERLTQPEPDFYGYASRLAVAIWEQHYKDVAPQWKPLDDLIGVLTQIDNMTTGLTRLAQPEQEPVAWMWKDGTITSDPDRADGTWTPLYTAPPRREWVGLTDEAIWLEYQRFWPFHPAEEPKLAKDIAKFARAIEAKLKEKNT